LSWFCHRAINSADDIRIARALSASIPFARSSDLATAGCEESWISCVTLSAGPPLADFFDNIYFPNRFFLKRRLCEKKVRIDLDNCCVESLAGVLPMDGRADFGGRCTMDEDILRKMEERLGPHQARRRLGIETDHEAQIFGRGLLSLHIENWYPVHSVIRNALKLTGLYCADAEIQEAFLVKRNDVMFKELPPLFDGFTILHLSDMHVDMNEAAMQRLIELVSDIRYDLCVLTATIGGRILDRSKQP